MINQLTENIKTYNNNVMNEILASNSELESLIDNKLDNKQDILKNITFENADSYENYEMNIGEPFRIVAGGSLMLNSSCSALEGVHESTLTTADYPSFRVGLCPLCSGFYSLDSDYNIVTLFGTLNNDSYTPQQGVYTNGVALFIDFANISFDAINITGIPSPVNDTSPVNKKYVDDAIAAALTTH